MARAEHAVGGGLLAQRGEWSTEQLYDEARARASEIVAAAGLPADEWERVERRLDVKNVATLGYSRERFPTSCVQAYHELCLRDARAPDPAVSTAIRRIAGSVFERDPPVAADARETLSRLRERGVRLALLTKEDPEGPLASERHERPRARPS